MASNPGPAANSNPTAAINKHLYRDYRAELAKLTFSSKPIINELSKKAEANVAEAETIITAIENHLRFTVPKLKLPAFYLLDSIIKNVGGMYVSLLHGRIGKIFVEMWKSVDDEVKGNMERTMGTWRHGFEGGHKNVFPDFVLRKIEEDINRLKAKAKDLTPTLPETKGEDLLDDLTKIQSYGKKHALEQRQQLIQREVVARADRYANTAGQDHAANKRRRMPEQERPIHNQDLLREVSNALVKKQVELYRCPSDVVLFSAINALKKIKASVAETTLSPERVREIRRQLLDLDSTSNADATNPQNSNNSARAQWHAGNGAPGSTRSTTPPHPPPAHVMTGSVRHDSSSQSTAFPSPQGHGASHGGRVGSLITQSPGAAMPTDANQLLQNLMSRPDLMSSLSKVAPGLSTSLGALLVPQHQGSGYKYFSQLEPIPLTQASIT
ncbi:mRNA 3' end processing factor, partial [Kickxella alabastrina]